MMIFAIFFLSVLRGTVANADQNRRDSSPSSCPVQCHIYDASMGVIHGWASPQDGLPIPDDITGRLFNFPRTSMTATIVTEVNTVLHTTQIVTRMPSGWTPPATNAGGTQIQTITYGANSTTTLAYPSAFIEWPSSYAWQGTMWDAEATGCVTATTLKPTRITTVGPQPTKPINMDAWSYSNSTFETQLKGLFASPLRCYGELGWPAGILGFNGEGRSINSCVDDGTPGPNWGGFLTEWAVDTATVYTG